MYCLFFQCKKVFPRRQNYHFHRTKGRCPGAPQPPKYHKLYESKYYCVHPDCGSGDGELRDNTPCFTSRGKKAENYRTGSLFSKQTASIRSSITPISYTYLLIIGIYWKHLLDKHIRDQDKVL